MKSKKKIIKLFILILCITLVFILAWSIRYELASQGFGVMLKDTFSVLFKTAKYPISLVNNPVKICSVSERIALVTDRNYALFDPVGYTVLEENYFSSSPVIKSSGNYYIIYSTGSSNIVKYSGSKMVFDAKIDGSIVCADITSRGYLALTYYNGITYSLVVYDEENDILLKYNTDNFLLTDVSLSSDNKSVAIGCIYLKDGNLCSKVRVLRIYDGSELNSMEFDNEMILKCILFTNEKFTAITDSALYIGEKKAEFEGKLTNYKLLSNGDAVVVDSTIKYYKSNGTFYSEKDLEDNIQTIYECKDGIVLFGNSYAHHLNTKLELISSMYVPSALDIALTNKYLYYIDSVTLCRVPMR